MQKPAEQLPLTRLFTSATRVQNDQSLPDLTEEAPDTSQLFPSLSPSSSGLGHRPFTARTGVQSPPGTPPDELAPIPELAQKILKLAVPASGGCIEWRGAASSKGYGRLKHAGKLYSPHRVVLENELGRRMLRGEDTRHKCDNPRCVNPEHLEPGTRRQNVMDALARGRMKPPAPSSGPRPGRVGAPRCAYCGRFLSGDRCMSDWCPDATAEDDDAAALPAARDHGGRL